MDLLKQSLERIDQADQLEQAILDALAAGDSVAAEKYSHQRQQIILAIPFEHFQETIPPELLKALHKLQQDNDKLTAITRSIQQEIGQQLSEVQKGMAGSKAYQDIHNGR